MGAGPNPGKTAIKGAPRGVTRDGAAGASLLLFAALGVLTGSQLARWFAVAVVWLTAIGQMFFISAYRFWSPDDHRDGRGGPVD